MTVHPFSSSSLWILLPISKLVCSSSTLPFVARVFRIEMFSCCLHSFSISFWMLSQSSLVIPSLVSDLYQIDLPFPYLIISSTQIQSSCNFIFGQHSSFIKLRRSVLFIFELDLSFISWLSSFFLNSIPSAKPCSVLIFKFLTFIILG